MTEYFKDGLHWFAYDLLQPYADRIVHGMFTRKGGVSTGPFHSLNAGSIYHDDPSAIIENRRRVLAALDHSVDFVSAHPVHGSQVIEVTAEHIQDWNAFRQEPERYPHGYKHLLTTKGDAMITRLPHIGLMWAYADCTPIMLFDPEHRAIALIHAGWRGMSQAIIVATIQSMQQTYGTDPTAVLAGIGPTIGPCCYEVDAPVIAAFEAHPIARQYMTFSTVLVTETDGRQRESQRLDLGAASALQLRHAGVQPNHIETFPLCTGCNPDLFYSYRKEQRQTGRHVVVIGLR